MEENRRQFFRLEYPGNTGPRFISGGVNFQVLDLSEYGLRLKIKSNIGYQSGTSFVGSLTFTSGESFLVFGTIKRITEDSLSIELKKAVPLRIIMAEQRRLIQLFPKRA